MEWFGPLLGVGVLFLIWTGVFVLVEVLEWKARRHKRRVKVTIVDDKMSYTIEGYSSEETARIQQQLEDYKKENLL